MAKKERNEVKAGIFVLAALAVTVGVLIWLGAADLFAPAAQEPYFFGPAAMGNLELQEGSELFYGSKKIGRVTAVVPLWGRGCLYRARIEEPDVTLHADAQAEVSHPFIGPVSLVIKDFGDEAAPAASAADPIRLQLSGMPALMATAQEELDRSNPSSVLGKLYLSVETVARITQTVQDELQRGDPSALMGKIHALLDELNTAAASAAEMAAVLQQEMPQREPDERPMLTRLRAALASLESVTASLADETDRQRKEALLAKVHGTLDEVNGILAEARPKLAKTLTDVSEAAEAFRGYAREDFRALLSKLDQTAEQVRQMVVGNRPNVDEMLDDMTLVAANLRATSAEVRREPWKLLRRPDRSELRVGALYDAAVAYAEGAAQLDQAVTKLQALQRLPADDPQLEQTVAALRKHLQDSFDKFKKVEETLWKELE